MTPPAMESIRPIEPIVPIAPISRRVAAYVIDAFIAAVLATVLVGVLILIAYASGTIGGILTTLVVGGPIALLVLLGWFLIYTGMQSGQGSFGMHAQGVLLVSADRLTPLGFGRTLLRNIIFGLTGAIVVGYVSPLFDGSGRFQGWHDKVVGSLMLDAQLVDRAAPRAINGPPIGQSADPAPPAPRQLRGDPVGGNAPAATGLQTLSSYPTAPPRPAMPASPSPAAFSPAVPPSSSALPPAARQGGADPVIAFVPGITQDPPAPRVSGASVAEGDVEDTVAPSMPVSAGPPPASRSESTAAAVPPGLGDPSEPEEIEDIEDTRISVPGHRLVFTWDDGTQVSVSRRTLFGRNPTPEDGAVAVSVRDETLSLSKTHFEAAAEATGAWVLDRHSTNGLILVRDGHRSACPPGQRVPVRLGDAIEIGERIVTIGGYA